MSVTTRAVVAAAEAEKVATPVAAIDQSSPPVKARVVAALLLPTVMTSAAVEFVAIFTVFVPLFVTPPMSIVLVTAASLMFKVVAASKALTVVEAVASKLKVPDDEVKSPPLRARSPAAVIVPLPRKEKLGLVVALPKAKFSEVFVVLMLM